MREIVIEDTPPSKNQMRGSHWSQDWKVREDWADMTFAEVENTWEDKDVELPVAIFFLIYEDDKRKRDTLNYADEGLHGIQDGFVRANVLPDDNTDYVKADYVQTGYSSGIAHIRVRLIPFREVVERMDYFIQAHGVRNDAKD